MIAGNLLSTHIFPLKKNDTVEDALMFLSDWKISCLPVVDGGKVIGFIEQSAIYKAPKKDKLIHHLQQGMVHINSSTVHLFELFKLFVEHQLSAITIIENDVFVGIVSWKELLDVYKNSSLLQSGAIIQIQMTARNYSLAEISRLIESNDVKILHVQIQCLNDDEGHIEVSLKLNSIDLKNVLNTLERYQYNVTAIFNANQSDDNLRSRFDNLIKYLNI